jgi:hypothetical protein
MGGFVLTLEIDNLLFKLLYLFKLQLIFVIELQLKVLELLNQFWRLPLEFIKDRSQLPIARMKVRVLELLSLVPVSTKVAVNLELRAIVLQMLVDAFDRLHYLSTGDTLDLHTLAFVFNVLFKVL